MKSHEKAAQEGLHGMQVRPVQVQVKETVYLVVDRVRVDRMTKSLPTVARGQIPVKLVIDIKDSAFRPPVIEQTVTICDWRDGIDLEDVQFKSSTITAEEAGVIRERRLAKMRSILEQQGYTVTGPGEVT